MDNGYDDSTLFSTYGANSGVNISSLLGNITIQGSEYNGSASQLPGGLADAYFSDASTTGLNSHTFTSEKNLTKTPWTLMLDPTVSSNGNYDSVREYNNFYNFSPLYSRRRPIREISNT